MIEIIEKILLKNVEYFSFVFINNFGVGPIVSNFEKKFIFIFIIFFYKNNN